MVQAELSGKQPVIPSYVAHKSEDGARFESVHAHLREVAEMASEFAEPFGAEKLAYAAGIMHDIGKYSNEFQKRILRDGPRVDHSTAGAYEMKPQMLGLLSYCIAGHHGGLPDGNSASGSNLLGRLDKAKNGELPDYGAFAADVVVPVLDASALKLVAGVGEKDLPYACSFLVRMVFSCLVDADFLCTERFMSGAKREGLAYDGLPVLRDKLERALAKFYPPKTPVNEMRCGLLDDCRSVAAGPRGLYTLTAPTGSGKTLALMRFACAHACEPGNGMRRVIIAEPYTSIIEQNAQVYREIFGAHNVLEHHANFDFDRANEWEDGMASKLHLAAENWDAPVVVTTNVQLFESLYAHKTSRCRKLHNIAGSVIVLDEAQAIPTKFLTPCVKALAELVRAYGCTVVLSSATQPALDEAFKKEGLAPREIVSDVPKLFAALERVTYKTLGCISDDDLACRLAQEKAALCVVNSRKQARVVYDLLQECGVDESGLFYLTTYMYPEHRREVIARINERLRVDATPCVVVATSLIEAGVDMDFPVVYRALTGVDSMVQAAGRCNREGDRDPEQSITYVFEPQDAYAVPGEILKRKGVSRGVLPELFEGGHELYLGSPKIIRAYFNNLFFFSAAEHDKAKVAKRLCESKPEHGILSIPFAEVANDFRLIDDGAYPIVIALPEIAEEVERLREGIASRGDMRRLSRYTVSVYKQARNDLYAAGAISEVSEGLWLLEDASQYGEATGLDINIVEGKAVVW